MKHFENLIACNGKPGIKVETETPVYRPNGKLADIQVSKDCCDIVYEVSLGDYICVESYDYETKETFISWYKVIDINNVEVIAEPS